MFREQYHHLYEQIEPSPQLVNTVIGKVNNNKKKFIIGKSAAIAAVLMICIFTTIPVLASNVPAVYETIYQISPGTAQFFKPVRESCEDNGIKMQVEAAYIHDNIAEIYISMQDRKGDRIDETTDLFDSYSINLPFSSAAGCVLAGYDKQSKTATFLITISQFDNVKITGKKLTFSVKEFLSGEQSFENTPIDADLSAADSKIPTQLVSISGCGGNYEKYLPDLKDIDYDDKAKVLSGTGSLDSPVENVEVTAIGYVDGMLHVQTATKNKQTTDHHGFVYLKDKNGNTVPCEYNVVFRDSNSRSMERIDYYEFVFDVPQSEIGQYSLYGDFFLSGQYTKGNWEVTFPLEEGKR